MLEKSSDSHRWAAATTGSQQAAGYQLASQKPVMAIGGFNGSDPYPSLEQFKQYVKDRQIHYYIAGEMGGHQMGGGFRHCHANFTVGGQALHRNHC